MIKKIKKSAVDLTDLAMGVLVLGITVSIGAVILTNYGDSRVTSLDTGTVTNESATGTVDGDTLAVTYVKSFDTVYNGTDELIASGNYTTSIDSDTGVGTITMGGNSEYNTSAEIKVTYDYYNLSSPEYSLSHNASLGLAEYGNWFTIIVIVGVASVILSLIFMAFGGNRESGGVSY